MGEFQKVAPPRQFGDPPDPRRVVFDHVVFGGDIDSAGDETCFYDGPLGFPVQGVTVTFRVLARGQPIGVRKTVCHDRPALPGGGAAETAIELTGIAPPLDAGDSVFFTLEAQIDGDVISTYKWQATVESDDPPPEPDPPEPDPPEPDPPDDDGIPTWLLAALALIGGVAVFALLRSGGGDGDTPPDAETETPPAAVLPGDDDGTISSQGVLTLVALGGVLVLLGR